MHTAEFNRIDPKDEWHGVFTLADEAATGEMGAALASALEPGLVIYLEGDLGAGKTTLTRTLLRALGHTGPVKSPTYGLVEVYTVSRLYLYHFDFYRFGSPEEFFDAGLGEYFRKDSICVVEWPEKAAGYVPPADLSFSFSIGDGEVRCLRARSGSEEGWQCLMRLSTALETLR